MVEGFRRGRTFHLSIRNEQASAGYTTDFLCQLFAEESGGLFDVRPMILGHLQQGGNPTAFDRAHAARLAAHCVDWLTGRMLAGRKDWHYATLQDGRLGSARIVKMDEVYDMDNRRPLEQWWMPLLDVMDTLAWEPAIGGAEGQPAASS
jgi:6-phosphofructokinase 1